jgi:hypothetical protein
MPSWGGGFMLTPGMHPTKIHPTCVKSLNIVIVLFDDWLPIHSLLNWVLNLHTSEHERSRWVCRALASLNVLRKYLQRQK